MDHEHLNIAPCLSLLIEDLGKALHGTGGHLQLEMVPSSQGALVDACLHVLKVGCRRPKPYSLQVNCIWALGVMTSAALMQAPVEAMFAWTAHALNAQLCRQGLPDKICAYMRPESLRYTPSL